MCVYVCNLLGNRTHMGGELSKREGVLLLHLKAKRGVFAVSFTDLSKFTL